MKILFIQYYGWEFGGGETYSFNLKSELAKRGHEVKIFSSNNNSNARHFSDYEFAEMNSRILKSFSHLFNLRSYFELKRVVTEFEPDIVHIQSMDEEVTGSILCCLNDFPKILTLHGTYLRRPLGFNVEPHKKYVCEVLYGGQCARCMGLANYIHAKVKSLVWGLLLPKIDVFISPSKYSRSLHENIVGDIRVLPNGIQLSHFSKIVNCNNILLYAGRLSHEKGVGYLIDAMPMILRKVPNMSLTIIGDGPEWENLNSKVGQLGLNDEIRFLGQIENNDISRHIGSAAILVVPSIGPELFGLVGVEAMSVGRPVIASRVGGIPEWLEDGKTGFLVDPGSSDQIAEKVIQLLSDRELLDKMGKYAHQEGKQFSIEKHVDKLATIYLEMIGRYNNV